MGSQKLINFAVESPKKSLVLCFLVILLLIPGLLLIKVDFSYRIWFQEGSAALNQFDKFEKQFGNDEVLLAAVYHEKGIFNKKSLEIIQGITEEMWKVEGVVDVDSVTNFHYAFAKGDEIIIEPLFEELSNKELLKRQVERAFENKIAPNYLFNKDGTMALIYAKQRPYFKEHPNEKLIVDEGRSVISKFQQKYPGHKIILSGGITVADAYREVAEGDLKRLLGIMFLFIALLLGFFFRNIKGVIFPFMLIGGTVLVTMGSSGIFQISFNNIVALIPQTLMAIAIADAVHIIVNYVQFKREGFNNQLAARKTLEKNFWPTFFTSLSTIFGFMSFITAVITPLVHFGLLAALGTVAAWLLSIFGLGALLSLGGRKRNPQSSEKRIIKQSKSKFVKSGVQFIIKSQSTLVMSALILMGGSTFIGLMNEVNSNPVEFFKDDVPAKITNDFILEQLGGFSGPQIVVDSGLENGGVDPDLLSKVQLLEKWLVSQPEVIKVTSIVDIIRVMNKALNEDKEHEYRIPDSREKISELLLLYQMSLSSGKSINERITIDRRFIRLTLFWSIQNSKQAGVEYEKIKKKAKELDLNITITGKSALFQSLNDKVVYSFLSSMSLAFLLVSCLIVYIFGSFKVGIISLIPNILPLAMGAAVMTILDIPLSIGTCLVFSVCLGIVVDDSIHFLLSYRRQILKGVSKELAIQEVMFTTGTSLFITTVILFFAFGLFAFAQFVPNMHFGIIASVIFVTALFADLVILPALLLKIDL
ncbi:MAG: putative RND superfamily exporter protein [Bacteriovoracaceae bacterium]|jgi:predicted RND superfamily exporter protein